MQRKVNVYEENGDIERYNVFRAIMLVRHAEDDKLYLYDIMKIKKRNEHPFPVRRPYSVTKPISFLIPSYVITKK